MKNPPEVVLYHFTCIRCRLYASTIQENVIPLCAWCGQEMIRFQGLALGGEGELKGRIINGMETC